MLLQNVNCLAGNYEMIATMITHNNDSMVTYHVNGTATVNGGILNGTIQTRPLSKATWNLTLDVQINHNHFIKTSKPITFSKFDTSI